MVAIPHCLKMRTGNKGIDLCILLLSRNHISYRTFALNACQAWYCVLTVLRGTKKSDR